MTTRPPEPPELPDPPEGVLTLHIPWGGWAPCSCPSSERVDPEPGKHHDPTCMRYFSHVVLLFTTAHIDAQALLYHFGSVAGYTVLRGVEVREVGEPEGGTD